MTIREPSVSEVRSELQSVLSSRVFRQSRGLAKLLSYICSKALVEGAEPITEYTIAVDVLGKPQNFKESKDASVRVEVHRLRKRLAEFYDQEGARRRIRIAIPIGQYAPRFLWQDVAELAAGGGGDSTPTSENRNPIQAAPILASSSLGEETNLVPARSRAGRYGVWTAWSRIAIMALAVLAAVFGFQVFARLEDPLDMFWRPVFSSSSPILLCIGNLEGGRHSAPGSAALAKLTMRDFHGLESETVLFSDAATLSRFTGLLQAKGKPYRVVSQSEATFSDLQSSPAVLIGLLNNHWTERLVEKLRFRVERQPTGKVILRDRDNPARDDWSMDYAMRYLDVTKDYALVVRVLDPKTEQMVVTAAGISVFGTLAAGEFLTSAHEFKKLEAVAPKGWKKKNFEIVLSTDVIRGKSGHPNIVAAHFW